jgi:AraC family transcriptional regulator
MIELERGWYLGINRRDYNIKGLLVRETEYLSKVYEGWHTHSNAHITFILTGGNREQRKSAEFEASPGKVIFYNSGEVHRNFNTAPCSKNINVEIESNFLEKYNIKEASIGAIVQANPDAKFLLLKIYYEMLKKDLHSGESIQMLFLNLVTMANHLLTKEQPSWIKIIYEQINDRWAENITLDELAKAANVHPVTISKHFPKFFSCTLGEYMRKLKVEKALSMLKSTSLSLTEIAYTCGFADQSHFTHTFKQITGFLPGQYRKI